MGSPLLWVFDVAIEHLGEGEPYLKKNEITSKILSFFREFYLALPNGDLAPFTEL